MVIEEDVEATEGEAENMIPPAIHQCEVDIFQIHREIQRKEMNTQQIEGFTACRLEAMTMLLMATATDHTQLVVVMVSIEGDMVLPGVNPFQREGASSRIEVVMLHLVPMVLLPMHPMKMVLCREQVSTHPAEVLMFQLEADMLQ